MTDGPQGPQIDLLSDVRFELIALNEAIQTLIRKASVAPQVTVEPTPVSVSNQAVDLSPLIDSLRELQDNGQQEELQALRKEFSDLAVAIRAIAGSSYAGVGGSVVTPGDDFPVKNSADHPLHVTVDNAGSTTTVEGTVDVGNFPAVQTVEGTVAVSGTVQTSESYTNLEVLPDQAGGGDVLTFTFTSTPKLIWVISRGAASRAAITDTPTATFGIFCDDGVPQPMTVESQTVQVYAPGAATVTVWGYS